MGWLSGYKYRKKVTISGSSGAGENYQVKLKIGSSSGGDFHLEGHCEDFPNDIRFTDNDGTTLLDYWIEDSSEDPITVWVEVNDNLDNNVDIYVYYGKSGEAPASDAEATFIRVINGNQPVKGSWHFDENSGITAEDTSGNDYDGSIHGADWTTGKFGSALSFNGSSDYVDCENVGTSIDKTYSVSLRFKVDSLSHEMQIFSGGGASGDNRYPDIVLWTSGKIGFRINDADPGAQSAEGLISLNTWYHVVGVVESDGRTTRLYVNGDEKATHVHTSDAVFYDDVNIGRRGNGTNYFDGIIDEVFVFNRALSAEETSDLYNNYGYTTINYPGRVLIRKYVSPEPSFSSAQSEEGPVFTCGDVLNGSSTLSSLLSVTVRSQDSLELIDSSASLIILLLNAIDSIDTSDGCTLSFLFTSSCLDVLHAIDSASYPLPNVVNCLDNLGAQDTLSSLLTVLCQSKDSIGGADGESSQLSSLSVLFDKLSSIDSTLSNVTFKQTLLDSLFLHDNSTLLLTILVFASDILASHDFNAVRLEFSSSSLDILKSQDNTSTNVVIHLNSADILKGADFISANLQALLSALSTFQQSDLTSSYKTLTGIPIKIFKAQHKVLVFRAE